MSDKTENKDSASTKSDADTTSSSDSAPAERTGKRRLPSVDMKFDLAAVRTWVARIVWAVAVLFAAVLAATVLFVALDANPDNDLVDFCVNLADKVDFGVFDLTAPIKDFDTKLAAAEDTKTALFNYGIAAIAWLAIGRVADRLIRP